MTTRTIHGPLSCVLCLAAHVMACQTPLPQSNNDAGIVNNEPVFINQELLAETARFLSGDALEGRDEGTAGSDTARAHIIAQLSSCGVQPAGVNGFEQPITTGQGTNILGKIIGTDPVLKDRYLLVSAHYDHLGARGNGVYNGAGDNAAAVAILIGVACELAKTPLKHSVLVASWDSEEPPTYMSNEMGSEFFAANPTVPISQIDVAVVMDLVGLGMWPGFQGHMVTGSEYSSELAAALAATVVPADLVVAPLGLHLIEEQLTGGTIHWSDYSAFLDHGRPSLFLSDGQNKHYHQLSDTFETLDLVKMTHEAAFLNSLMHALDRMPANPSFNRSQRNYLVDAQSLGTLLGQALETNGIVDSLNLGAQSRASIEGDRQAVSTVQTSLESGATASDPDIMSLRLAAQRLMCFSGPRYNEATCNSL